VSCPRSGSRRYRVHRRKQVRIASCLVPLSHGKRAVPDDLGRRQLVDAGFDEA